MRQETETARQRAASAVLLDIDENARRAAAVDPSLVLEGPTPRLVDEYYWTKLTEGGEESQCGWLKDRYGLSWQVCPAGLGELISDPDKGRSNRAMEAMLGMKKIDVAALYAAADQA